MCYYQSSVITLFFKAITTINHQLLYFGKIEYKIVLKVPTHDVLPGGYHA